VYKDKDRQREANREQMRRARAKGNTKQDISQGNTEYPRVTDKALPGEPIPQGWEDEISDNLERTGNIQGIPKRGKDIKCFEDLPPDVQQTIKTISESNEEFQRRTGIAIRYQHLFPDRYYSTGVAI